MRIREFGIAAVCFGLSAAPLQAAPLERAVAVLESRSDSAVKGTVTFTLQGQDRVLVEAFVVGLSPGKLHGFHVHETGDCSAPDGSSAGGHFNPHKHPHGAPTSAERHAGDLGNLTADASGAAVLVHTDSLLELSGPSSIRGRAVIVHAGADDLVTQPTGNAGARIACGVIK